MIVTKVQTIASMVKIAFAIVIVGHLAFVAVSLLFLIKLRLYGFQMV